MSKSATTKASANNSQLSELIEAVKNNDEASISAIIGLGAQIINVSNEFGTPLTIAAENGYSKIMQLLVDAGADINLTSKSGNTPLRAAIFSGDGDCISLAISLGADVNACTPRGTALIAAASLGDCETISLLVSNGVVIDFETRDGWTALLVAVREDRREAVQKLLQLGASLDRKNCDNLDALSIAEERVLPEMYALLLQSQIQTAADDALAASERRQDAAALEVEAAAKVARAAAEEEAENERKESEVKMKEISAQTDDLIERLGLQRRNPVSKKPDALKAWLESSGGRGGWSLTQK